VASTHKDKKKSKDKDKKGRRKSDEKLKKRKSLEKIDQSKTPSTPQAALPPPPLPPPPISHSPHVELPGGFSDLVDGQTPVKKRGRPLGSKNKGPRRRPGEESTDGDSKRRKVKRNSTTDSPSQHAGTQPMDSVTSTDPKTIENQAISSPNQSKPLASAAKASTPTPSTYPPKTTTPTSQSSTFKQVVSPSTSKGAPVTPSKPRKVHVPNSAITPTTSKSTSKPTTPSTPNSPSYNMYISKRTNGTSGIT